LPETTFLRRRQHVVQILQNDFGGKGRRALHLASIIFHAAPVWRHN
jgi:hypothetical protein